jgi:hypothetical protein
MVCRCYSFVWKVVIIAKQRLNIFSSMFNEFYFWNLSVILIYFCKSSRQFHSNLFQLLVALAFFNFKIKKEIKFTTLLDLCLRVTLGCCQYILWLKVNILSTYGMQNIRSSLLFYRSFNFFWFPYCSKRRKRDLTWKLMLMNFLIHFFFFS